MSPVPAAFPLLMAPPPVRFAAELLPAPQLSSNQCRVFRAGVLGAAPPVAQGLVPIALFLLQIVNFYMMINVGKARKTYGSECVLVQEECGR